jgi:hypothetical protein
MKLDGYLRSENVFIDLYIQSFIVLTDSSAWVASEKGRLAPVRVVGSTIDSDVGQAVVEQVFHSKVDLYRPHIPNPCP